jgi:hypothetical protein
VVLISKRQTGDSYSSHSLRVGFAVAVAAAEASADPQGHVLIRIML